MALIDDLISYYKLDEAAGAVLDAHGAYNGIASGAVPGATGIINTGYDFERDRVTDEIEITSIDPDNYNSGFSVSIWVKFESVSPPEAQMIFVYEGSQQVFIRLDASNNLDVRFGNTYLHNAYAGVTTGTWYHLVITHDANYNKLYVNGVLKASAASTPMSGVTTLLHIGNLDSQLYSVDGIIDEVGIWGKKLTDGDVSVDETAGEQVAELYNSGAGLAYPFAVGTNMQINIGDAWKDADAVKVNIGDAWKDVAAIKQNIGDVWKDVF